jgi:uncharacterized protein YqhQ
LPDADATTQRPDPPPTVGGSALPGGVMMRTPTRVGIAVRHEETGEILTDAFPVEQPKGRWLRWPLARGVWAMHTALQTGKRAMSKSEKLRWGEEPGDALEVGTWGKIMIGLAALAGAAIQIAAFRVGPVVVAKEAGLTGAAFIVADAFIRLGFLIGTLLLISYLPPFRRLLAYHGAEHKTIAAFESGAGFSPLVSAGKSRFHPRCGTSFLVVSALVSIGVYGAVLAVTGIFTYPALILTRILGAPIVTAITFELQRQAAKHSDGRLRFLSWPGMAAQRLTTAEPRHEELEVASRALEVALEEQPERELETEQAPVAEGFMGRAEPQPQPQPSPSPSG